MLRRVLPVAGAAALVLVPSSAWAAPGPGPVNHYGYAGYFAMADATLADGRLVTATLTQYYAANHRESSGFVNLQVQQPCVVMPSGWRQCAPSASGYAELTGGQVEFDRGLRGASVEDISLTLTTPAYDVPGTGVPGGLPTGADLATVSGGLADPNTPPLGPPPFPPPPPGEFTPPVHVSATTEVVTFSLDFTGTGTISRSAQHTVGDCGMDSTGCQSTHVGAVRTADVTVTLVSESGETSSAESDAGRLTFDQSVDVAAPRPTGQR